MVIGLHIGYLITMEFWTHNQKKKCLQTKIRSRGKKNSFKKKYKDLRERIQYNALPHYDQITDMQSVRNFTNSEIIDFIPAQLISFGIKRNSSPGQY